MNWIIHIVWAPTGPIAAYRNPEIAHAHARTMVGVDVASVELRDTLPDVVKEDLHVDFEHGNDTPVTEIPIHEIDEIKTDE